MPPKAASRLVKVLEATRPAIEAALAEAQQELAELNARRGELERLIARARAVLNDDAPVAASAQPERLTLHEAMEQVLDEHENRWMTVHELADEINERGLYEKRDRSRIEPSQIHARANKYDSRFEKDGPRVRRVSG
jgi:HB1, ASXL, restriction endonuclease HTH domain